EQGHGDDGRDQYPSSACGHEYPLASGECFVAPRPRWLGGTRAGRRCSGCPVSKIRPSRAPAVTVVTGGGHDGSPYSQAKRSTSRGGPLARGSSFPTTNPSTLPEGSTRRRTKCR